MTSRDPPASWDWAHELRGALNATAAMLPFVLSYGFIAFGSLGAVATQPGLTASVVGVVLGGLLFALGFAGSRGLPLPAASPSASCCMVLAAGVAGWLDDPALQPGAPTSLAALLALTGATVMLAGALQVVMGLLRMGRLVRYVPQPVLAGFMNGVAVLIMLSQLGPALGIDAGVLAREGWSALVQWQALPLAITVGTAVLVAVCARLVPRLPATLLALVLASAAVWLIERLLLGPGGVGGIARIGPLQPALPLPLALDPLRGADGAAWIGRQSAEVIATAVLLALIGALESVLNVATIDQHLRTRSNPDRVLLTTGLVNVALGPFGALPVVYLRIRALATLQAGGRTWRAMVAGSLLIGLVFTLGLPLVAWFPKPVVAGILVMLAWSLVDPWSLGLLRRDRTDVDAATEVVGVTDRRLSLAVVAAVGVVTVASGFVAGVALGVLLSFVILVRALNRSLVRLRFTAAAMPSRRVYAPAHESALAAARPGIAVLELEGALYFGSVDRLELEVEALVRETAPAAALTALVLDLRRVSTVDTSGAVMLGRLRETLGSRGVLLRLAGVTRDNRHGESLRAHGMLGAGSADTWALHEDTDRAVEAAEQAALARAGLPPAGTPLALAQCALLAGLDAAAFERVQALLPERRLAAGERLFAQGEAGDTIYVLCAGSISVLERRLRQRFVSFSPGMTFGELSVLDGGDRTADAVADEPSIVRSLPAEVMKQLEREAPAIAALLYRNLARHLAERLRKASEAWGRAAG